MERSTIGFSQGTAYSVGAILGPGVLALPALASQAAGPASIISWFFLIVMSVPVAIAFARLGAEYPDDGGISSFVSRAFGPRYSTPVGWWFYLVGVPVGVLAAAVVGANYVVDALGLEGSWVLPLAGALLLLSAVSNYMGLRFTGRVQITLIVMLVALIVMAIALAVPNVESRNFTPFVPNGWWSIGISMTVLFYAFAGWEAVSHLSRSFSRPRTQIPRVALLTLLIVGVLYAGLAVTTTGALGARAANTAVPLTLLFEQGLGATGPVFTAMAALVFTFSAVNAYIAGGSALGVALADNRQLPARLGITGHSQTERHKALRRSLFGVSALAAFCLAATVVLDLTLVTLMTATSSCLHAVTVAGLIAALRLLPRSSSLLRVAVAAATVLLTVALVFYGAFLLLPLVVGALALLYERRTLARRPGVVAVASSGDL